MIMLAEMNVPSDVEEEEEECSLFDPTTST